MIGPTPTSNSLPLTTAVDGFGVFKSDCGDTIGDSISTCAMVPPQYSVPRSSFACNCPNLEPTLRRQTHHRGQPLTVSCHQRYSLVIVQLNACNYTGLEIRYSSVLSPEAFSLADFSQCCGPVDPSVRLLRIRSSNDVT
jgi:hypothetical protein